MDDAWQRAAEERRHLQAVPHADVVEDEGHPGTHTATGSAAATAAAISSVVAVPPMS